MSTCAPRVTVSDTEVNCSTIDCISTCYFNKKARSHLSTSTEMTRNQESVESTTGGVIFT